MQPIETEVILEDYKPNNLIDQLIDDEYLALKQNPKSEPMKNNFAMKPKSNQSAKPCIKSYELINETIQESYFEYDDADNDGDFISDFANCYPAGIILVVNEKNSKVNSLNFSLGKNLHHTIYCNSKTNSGNTDPSIKTEVDNINMAAKTAYNLAKNGQAILFQGVDKRFDFISHIF